MEYIVKDSLTGFIFDDFASTDPVEKGWLWSGVCNEHADFGSKHINEGGADGSVCGVKGCGARAEYYYDFKPEPETDVVFRKWPKEKETDRLEVIAFFPGIEHHEGFIMSYQHVGQHGAADPSLIHTLGHCTYSEYEPLLKELTEQVGYNLNVLSDREAAKLFA